MSITLGPDDFILPPSHPTPTKDVARRRTVSTSFEQKNQKKDVLHMGRKTQSVAQDMSALPRSLMKKKTIFDSFVEKEMIDEEIVEEVSSKKKIPFLGIILILVGILIFQSGSVLVKKLSVNPLLIVLIRDVLQASFNTPFLIQANQTPFPKGRITLVVIRGMTGGILIMGHFYAVRYLPIADVMMISSIRPVFVTLLSCIFLKEACGVVEILNLLLVISGIFLVVQPSMIFGSSDQEYTSHMLYTAIGLMAANALGGSINVILRYLRDMHWAALAVSTRIFGIAEMFAVCAIMGLFCVPECGFERWGIVLVAVMGCVTQVCFIFALKNEEAHIIGIVDNAASVVVSFVLQILFFNDFPNTLKIIGACLVLSSILIIGGQKIWKNKQKKEIKNMNK